MSASDLTDDILAQEKEELLALLLAETGATVNAPIPPAPFAARPPLSFAQQRLWFVERLGMTPGAYNIPIHLRLRGNLDVAALAGSLSAIVRRHQVLRTRFRTDGGEPYQDILEPTPVEIPVDDLSALPPDVRRAEVDRIVSLETSRPFDIGEHLPLRTRLLRLGQTEHLLLLTVHHIAIDGWSIGVLLRELSALYSGAAGLPALPIQYADYAVWQRERLQGEALEAELGYWRARLKNLPVLELPRAASRLGATAASSGSSETFEIPAELTARIDELARRRGVTPYMFLLAVFQVLLHRYTGQKVIPVGSPVANRNRAELEPLIGFFVNSLVLATDCGGDPTFAELLSRVRETVLGAMDHQEVPFEAIVEDLRPERNLARHPLFQVVFAMQQPDAMLPRLDLPGLSLERWRGAEIPVRFDLEMHLWRDGARLLGICMYRADVFDSAAVASLLGHFLVLLSGAIADPESRIADLPLLAVRERHEAEVVWNDTWRPPARGCFPAAFEQQAARHADAVAAVFEDRSITFRALNAQANRLAHHLRALGVGAEVAVGIRIERSLDMLIAVLAVLKAGGAYVPLDTCWPEGRIDFALRDTGARLVITREFLDRERRAIAAQSAANPAPVAGEDNLAYVLYTSGSTGVPKGVMMAHRGLMHYVSWCLSAYNLERGCGTLVHSSLSFDLTVTALLAPLAAGRCVRLIAEGPGIEALAEAIAEEPGLSLLKVTPAHLDLLGATLPATAAACSRALIVGGEALSAGTLSLWRRHAPGTRIINEYGPTESAVGCVVFDIPAGELSDGPVPIGQPIGNMQVYTVDAALQLVPVGIAGELLIGGPGLARGYLGRPGLTAGKWVPSPFGGDSGARLYRSGDQARRRIDGILEYLGRLDDQVKLRGYRIELGEIEAALGGHPSVDAACVLVRNDRLAAWIVARGEVDWRSYLGARLPDYMIPATYTMVDRLPLTANGKVDRDALTALERSVGEPPPVAGSELERRLAGIFADLLSVDRIQVDDNFFFLGGHSLLAYRLVSRIEEALAIRVPLRTVFTHPTVAAMSRWISENPASRGAVRLPKYLEVLQGAGAKRPLFLLPPAAGSPSCYSALAEALGEERPVYGFQSPGLLDGGQPLARVEEMAELCVEAMLAVQPAGPYHIAGWSFGSVLACGVARLLDQRGHAVSLLALLDGGMRDTSGLTGREKVAEALALPPKMIRATVDVLPRNYAELRRIGQWVGISLPESVRGLARANFGAQWKLLRTVFSGSVTAMRVAFANTKAGLTYSPEPYDGNITLFRTRLTERPPNDPLIAGLRRFTLGDLKLYPAPGSHMTLVLDPVNAAKMAAEMRNALSYAEEMLEKQGGA